jgi:hypothetical protein
MFPFSNFQVWRHSKKDLVVNGNKLYDKQYKKNIALNNGYQTKI